MHQDQIEFETCRKVDGVWVAASHTNLHLWVRRLHKMPIFQEIIVQVFDYGNDIDELIAAAKSLMIADSVACATLGTAPDSSSFSKTTYDVARNTSKDKWATAEDDMLVLNVRRSTVNGKPTQLGIRLRTSQDVKDLIEAVSAFGVA